jgi:hypothetical protein
MADLPHGAQSHPTSGRVRDALMRKLSGTERMFSLGGTMTRVIGMGYSVDEGSADLAYYVMADVALTSASCACRTRWRTVRSWARR